jgi:hypothetical protein
MGSGAEMLEEIRKRTSKKDDVLGGSLFSAGMKTRKNKWDVQGR